MTKNPKKYTEEAQIVSKKSKKDKYGDENYNNRDKFKQTCIDRYGVENPVQNYEISSSMKRKYFYDDTYFDSSWKLNLYIFLKEHNISFEFHPNLKFSYMYNEKQHYYEPDFIIQDKLYEIKGTHF